MNEFALLDIPCDEIPEWQDVAQLEVPQSVLNRLRNVEVLSGSFIQKLEDAQAAVVNMDYFAVTVPGNRIPNGWSATEYFNHIRISFNAYININISYLLPYPGLNDIDKWKGSNPLGSIFSFQLMPEILGIYVDVEDGSVVTTGIGSSFWFFSTLHTPEDGHHPVSGNRKFGFTNNGDGTFTFYTRGVDRLSTDWFNFSNAISGGLAFESADDLWSSFQQKIANDFGTSAVIDSITWRPNYNKVDAVLSGVAAPSTLGCQE